MAKLKARGRKELVRVTRITIPDEGGLTDWTRKTYALMSDGVFLEKLDVRFKPSEFKPEGEKHSYGWKVGGKSKKTVEQFVSDAEARGFKRV